MFCNHLFNLLLQGWQVLLNRVPDYGVVYADITMYEHISHLVSIFRVHF